MMNGRITYFLVIFQAVMAENKANSPKNSFPFKLLDDQTLRDPDFKCKTKCPAPSPPHNGQVRFIDAGTNSSADDHEMEAPAPKFSVLNLLTGDEEEEEVEEEEEDTSEYDEKPKDEKEDDDVINFFDDDDDDDDDEDAEDGGDNGEKISLNKLKDESEEGLLKQYNRHGFRMHNFVFPLLLAYKLKFFTVIPLLLGALVLLVGTTGIAGFFFALFAAALGIHVKSHDHF